MNNVLMNLDTDILTKVANLDKSKFQDCSFKALQEGDIVASWTMTHSQKYFFKPGYEGCNMIKFGILLAKNEGNPSQSSLLQYEEDTDMFIETNFYTDNGTSGWVMLKKYYE